MCGPTTTKTTTSTLSETEENKDKTTSSTTKMETSVLSSSSSSSTTSSTNNASIVVETSSSSSEIMKQGVLYGTISLALVVLANTVTMGHYQSQRDKLGCDSMCVGSITSARSTLTLIGSTIIGKCSDSTYIDNKFGSARRIFLFIGVIASAIGIIIASNVTTIQGLWISMIPNALLQQNFNILKALFGEYHNNLSTNDGLSSSSSSSSDRASSVGMLGMAAGLAFMIGPLAGTTILQTYEQASIFALLCLIGAAVIILGFIPSATTSTSKIETSKPGTSEQDSKSTTTTTPNTMNDSTTNSTTTSTTTTTTTSTSTTTTTGSTTIRKNNLLLLNVVSFLPKGRSLKPALFIMLMRLCMGLAFHIFNTIWMVTLKETFQFGPKQYGQYYAFIGLAFALSQGIGAKFFLNKFGTNLYGRTNLLLVCSFILGFGRFMVYQTTNIVIVYMIYGLIITALGIVNTIITADTSQIANPKELGGLFGIIASVESMAGIIGPILGGILTTKIHSKYAPLCAVVTLYGFVFCMVYFGYEYVITTSSSSMKTKESSSSSEKEEAMKEKKTL